MQLNYKQNYNGMYILSKNDIEDVAESVMKDYCPNRLVYPMALDHKDFLENYLGLTLKYEYIGTFNSGILGLIVMSDEVEIPSFDDRAHLCLFKETFGTVIINRSLTVKEQIPRQRYTAVHEGAHFILHREYYSKYNHRNYDYIACRNIELDGQKPNNDIDWIEWQADSLAAALLMPKNVFCDFTRSVIRCNGISRDYLIEGRYLDERHAYDIISLIAEKFFVSYKAAQIRMIHLGLIQRSVPC